MLDLSKLTSLAVSFDSIQSDLRFNALTSTYDLLRNDSIDLDYGAV